MNMKLMSSIAAVMSMYGGIAFADGVPPTPPQLLPYHQPMAMPEHLPLPSYMMEEPSGAMSQHQAWHMKEAMMGLGPAMQFMPSMEQSYFYEAFAKANITHDGHLTKSQAEASPELGFVVKNFDAIASKGKNYVTFGGILAWQLDQQAQNISDQMHKQAEVLRSEN